MEENENVQEKLVAENDDMKNSVRAYKSRWVILTIFMVYACINSIQWIEYSSITHIVVKYYNVSTLAVDWTSNLYMALYPFLVIPASYVIEKKGIRAAGLLGCIGTLVGTGLKVFSIRNDLFYIVLIGQAIVSASQTVIICLPPKIAAIWFKPNEVSTSCSLGVFGTQFGCAIGYMLPPTIVKYSENVEDIGSGLYLLCWILTASMIPATIALICYFPNQPPLPPSIAQATLRANKEEFSAQQFFISIKDLFKNRPFFIHMVAYGINIAVSSAVGTLLNQFILQYFEGDNEEAGRMGFSMVIAGTIGSIIFGIFLDKTHKYKETTLSIYFLCAVSLFAFMYALEWKSKIWSYITIILTGLFLNGYMPVGFEFAMELTFPAEECTTTGILVSMTQLLGVIFAVALGYINLWVGCFWSLGSQVACLLLGTLITWYVPNNLLRQEAFKATKIEFRRKASYHG